MSLVFMFIALFCLHLSATLHCSGCGPGPPPDYSHIKVRCNAPFGGSRDLS